MGMSTPPVWKFPKHVSHEIYVLFVDIMHISVLKLLIPLIKVKEFLILQIGLFTYSTAEFRYYPKFPSMFMIMEFYIVLVEVIRYFSEADFHKSQDILVVGIAVVPDCLTKLPIVLQSLWDLPPQEVFQSA